MTITDRPVLQQRLVVPSAAAMRAFGVALAGLLRAGDLLVLTGDLGAGKTTLTRGIGAGLGVRGDVTSPTFVIARVHPPLPVVDGVDGAGGPALVHVDAYRLQSSAEVDDLDLDATLAGSVTVVEWGEGLVEELAPDRLHVRLERPRGDDTQPGDGSQPGDGDQPEDGDQPRTVTLVGHGPRWAGVALPTLPGGAA